MQVSILGFRRAHELHVLAAGSRGRKYSRDAVDVKLMSLYSFFSSFYSAKEGMPQTFQNIPEGDLSSGTNKYTSKVLSGDHHIITSCLPSPHTRALRGLFLPSIVKQKSSLMRMWAGSGESVLFIGTQFSNLYTAVDTPAKGHVGLKCSFFDSLL